MTLMHSSVWRNFRPFPSIWQNFTSHRALHYHRQSSIAKSTKTFLTVYLSLEHCTWAWSPVPELGALYLSLEPCTWAWSPVPELGALYLSLEPCTWAWSPVPELGVLYLSLESCTWAWSPVPELGALYLSLEPWPSCINLIVFSRVSRMARSFSSYTVLTNQSLLWNNYDNSLIYHVLMLFFPFL